ncbi:peptidase S24-like protein [Cricetibacter osteomyelitidis]|uniref:Peptidase S24-like protein n=1 Tax=Cricetibacter osteomyelitidis TaxID=1521931 RepID=A0A4R2T3T8_9PAST|nr:S24 family peptidase [Cricetibacter osteomyelitidis]TCP97629.1 peptidase S24-like protein [Cricetibacter osteomyelitidis]
MNRLNTIQNADSHHYFSYHPLPFYDDRHQYTSNKNKKGVAKYKLDLNLYCIKRPQQTCFIQVNNPNMIAWGIEQGDMLVIEKNEQLSVGDLVVLEENEQFQIYEFFAQQNGEYVFMALDYKAANIKTRNWKILPIIGTVTSIIHQMKPKRVTVQ